jgi:hypothetical protein
VRLSASPKPEKEQANQAAQIKPNPPAVFASHFLQSLLVFLTVTV